MINQIVCAMAYLLKHETWSGSGQAFKWGPKATSEKICPAIANLDLENSSHCGPITSKIISWQ